MHRTAVRYWRVTQQGYYERLDVSLLNPQGAIFIALMITKLGDTLKNVAGNRLWRSETPIGLSWSAIAS